MGGSVIAEVVAGNDDAMEAIEQASEEAEGSSSSFLQRRHASAPIDKAAAGRQAIVALLRGKGKQLHSTLLSSLSMEVASTNSADVFAKVKVLIQELIERLLS